ncbi:MAG: MFS transporter [Candidatus Micrarchaeota archaeon]
MPKRAIRTYQILSLFYAGTFAFMAGLLPFILMAKGMDSSAIALYFAIYSFGALVLEVPSGAFADAHGRKNAIALGFLLQTIFIPAFILLPGGVLFTLFAFVVAAADSMMSGAAEAYAVDMINERERMDYTHRLLSSGRTYKFALFLVGSLVGGYAGTISILLPAALCFPFALGGLLFSWFRLVDDSPKKDLGKAERSILKKMALSIQESARSPSIGIIYIITLLLGLGTFGLFLYWQIMLNATAGWGPDMMGFFFALVSLCVIIGSRLSTSIRPGWKAVSIIMVTLAILLGLAAWTAIPLLLSALILLWEFVFGLYQPIEGAIINANTKSAIRATVMSVNALSYRVGWVVLGFIVAFFPISDPRILWYIGAVFLFMAAILSTYAIIRKLPSAAGTS